MATTVPNTFVNGTNADAPQVNANFAAHNAAIDAVALAAGVPTPAVKMRGVKITPATESRTNTAYGTLGTPDQVTGLVVPTNGLITVWFQATWQESVSAAARAAIFLGSNQLKLGAVTTTAPVVQEASLGGNAAPGTDVVLASHPNGLASLQLQTNAPGAYTGDVTTGQVVGGGEPNSTVGPLSGPVSIFAAAGTYTVSVQFKSSSGSVTVKNRRLYVEVVDYS